MTVQWLDTMTLGNWQSWGVPSTQWRFKIFMNSSLSANCGRFRISAKSPKPQRYLIFTVLLTHWESFEDAPLCEILWLAQNMNIFKRVGCPFQTSRCLTKHVMMTNPFKHVNLLNLHSFGDFAKILKSSTNFHDIEDVHEDSYIFIGLRAPLNCANFPSVRSGILPQGCVSHSESNAELNELVSRISIKSSEGVKLVLMSNDAAQPILMLHILIPHYSFHLALLCACLSLTSPFPVTNIDHSNTINELERCPHQSHIKLPTWLSCDSISWGLGSGQRSQCAGMRFWDLFYVHLMMEWAFNCFHVLLASMWLCWSSSSHSFLVCMMLGILIIWDIPMHQYLRVVFHKPHVP